MKKQIHVLAINGSASEKSSNLKLLERISELAEKKFVLEIFGKLSDLPHFDPDRTVDGTPKEIVKFRNAVKRADGIIICTPEYVFSIPSGLKNAIEWCVSTTLFSKKPVGLITASASGVKGHEELKLIMKTLDAVLIDETTLLIQGIKGKINETGDVTDEKTVTEIVAFIDSFKMQLQ